MPFDIKIGGGYIVGGLTVSLVDALMGWKEFDKVGFTGLSETSRMLICMKFSKSFIINISDSEPRY